MSAGKSRQWIRRHLRDRYVRTAWQHGYRSRAAWKLIEIDRRDRLIRPGMVAVDLGAAPGSWSQVLAERAGAAGRVIAVDLAEFAPLAGVTAITGDFDNPQVRARVEAALRGEAADLVVSDMAPHLSGVAPADQARSLRLCELALEFARGHLKPDGAFLVKVFQGTGYREFLSAMRAAFRSVAVRKPGASRSRSREVYLLGRGLEVTPAAGDSRREEFV